MIEETVRASPTQEHRSASRRHRRRRTLLTIGLILPVGLLLSAPLISFEYAYTPPVAKVLNPERTAVHAFDLWGRGISHEEVAHLRQTEEGRTMLSPANGAVAINDVLLALGRQAFYEETFGNEVFVTDIVGFMNGPLTTWSFVKALTELGGEGTDNLQVELAETVTVFTQPFCASLLLSQYSLSAWPQGQQPS
jgi:hypothetical protein